MKHTSFTKLTALLLAIVMLLPLISIPTFAAEVDPSKILYSEDFTSYEGLDKGIAAKYKTNFIAGPNNIEAVTEDGNTYLRFPMETGLVGGMFDGMKFGLKDSRSYSYWHQKYPHLVADSFNSETKELTFKNTDGGDDLVVTLTGNVTGKEGFWYYGNFTHTDGVTYMVADPDYAYVAWIGDAVVDKYAQILFGEKTFYTAEDEEVINGTKKIGDVKSIPAGYSYKDTDGVDKIVVSYDGMIESNSVGILNMQLNKIYDASGKEQNFIELGNLDLETGTWSKGCFNGVTFPKDEWFKLYFIVDLDNATIEGVYNGKYCGSVSCGNKGVGGITVNSWTISKIWKTANNLGLAGSWNVDNFQVLSGDVANSLIKFTDYINDFESANEGSVAPGFDNMNALNKVAIVEGNKVWAHGSSNDKTGVNNDNSSKLANEAFKATMNDHFVLSVDYFVPEGTSTRLQTQLAPGAYTGTDASGANVSGNWGDIYVINSENGMLTIGREADFKMVTLSYNEWYTIAVEFEMSTNTFDLYINGSYAFSGTVRDYKALDTIGANAFYIAKELSGCAQWNTGWTYIDNIKMTAGEYDSAFSADSVWTDAELYEYVLAFGDDNDEVAESEAFVVGHNFSFPSGLTFTNIDEEYFVPGAIKLAITDELENNVDKMVRPLHIGISAKKASMAVLSANYTVSEDAQGKIESELFDTYTWIHLFTIDADASTIEGVAFTKGETFNVTTVLDFATGTAYVYYNNLLINVVVHAKIANGLNSGEWSVAKVMKNCEAYAGDVVVTDMTITGKLADEKAENPFYLYESGEKQTLISTVDAASIRFTDPTGLRFAAKVNGAADLYAVADEVGIIIAPKDYVEAAGAFTTAALDTLGYVTNYLKINATEYYEDEDAVAALGSGKFVTASIVNILDKNIDREFAAIGYYVIDGVTYYAENSTVRSVQEIADAAIASGDYADNADALEILNKYATPAPVEE